MNSYQINGYDCIGRVEVIAPDPCIALSMLGLKRMRCVFDAGDWLAGSFKIKNPVWPFLETP